jgi:hypothetical protein
LTLASRVLRLMYPWSRGRPAGAPFRVIPPTPGPGAHLLLRKADVIDRRLTGDPLGTGEHSSANHTPRKEQQNAKKNWRVNQEPRMGREDHLRPHVLALFPYLMDKE